MKMRLLFFSVLTCARLLGTEPEFTDPLCALQFAQTAEPQIALKLYGKLIMEDALPAELRIEVFRNYTALYDQLEAESETADNAEALPNRVTALDVFGTYINTSHYRARVTIVQEQIKRQFAQLLLEMPDSESPEIKARAWRMLVEVTRAPANTDTVVLFRDNTPVPVFESRNLKFTLEEIAAGKLTAIPPEIHLWIETLHGYTVLINSGLYTGTDIRDLKTLKVTFTFLWLKSFDGLSLNILTYCPAARDALLEMGTEYKNHEEFRYFIRFSLLPTHIPALQELKEHFARLEAEPDPE